MRTDAPSQVHADTSSSPAAEVLSVSFPKDNHHKYSQTLEIKPMPLPCDCLGLPQQIKSATLITFRKLFKHPLMSSRVLHLMKLAKSFLKLTRFCSQLKRDSPHPSLLVKSCDHLF